MALFHKRCLTLNIFCDWMFLFLLLIPMTVLNFMVNPRRRGIFCHDETLSYPYMPQTVNNVLLTSVGVILSFGILFFVELICFQCRHNILVIHSNTRSQTCQFFMNFISRLVPYLFGFAITQITTDLGKYSVGRLRPHFLTLCQPNYSEVDCSVGYVTEYNCTGTDDRAIRLARLSFPSGHASFSFFCFVTLALYIHTSVPCNKMRLLKPIVQVALMLLAYFTTISRVFDHYHHYTDVIAGAALGILVGIFTNVVLFPRFERKIITKTKVELEDVKSTNPAKPSSPSQVTNVVVENEATVSTDF